MAERYVDKLWKFRWPIIIITVLVVLGAVAGTKKLFFNNDYRTLFSPEDPHLQAFEKIQDTYTKNDSVLMVIAPNDGVVFKPKTLEAIEDLTERAWQTPYSTRVDSLSNYQHSQSVGEDMFVANLYEEATQLTNNEVSALKEVVLNEPQLVHRLISEQAHATAINITVGYPAEVFNEQGEMIAVDTTRQFEETAAYVRELKDYLLKTYPEHKVYMTGTVMLNNAFGEVALYDVSYLVPLAIFLILVTVYLLLRSISGALITLIIALISIMIAFGLAGWIGIELSAIVMSAPIIIMTLAVADCVHILSSWISGLRAGKNKIIAMQESLRINFKPIFLTSVTTAISLLSLNASDAPPFVALGNIAAMGVMVAFVLSISLLPALTLVLPTNIQPKTTQTSQSMVVLADWVVNRHKLLLIVMGSSAILLIALLPKNEINDVFVRYFDERIEVRTDTDYILKNLTGISFVDYSIETKDPGGIVNPDTLNDIKKFSDWLEIQPEVIHVSTLTNTFARLNKSMHSDDQRYYKLPESRELAAQYLLLYEMSLPFGLDLNNQIDIDKSSTRVTATLQTLSVKDLLAYEKRVEDWMATNIPDKQTQGASRSIMFSYVGMKNIISMLGGTTIALVLISLILIVALRSVKYGLLSLIPNLIPAGMAFGIWALISGEIGLGLSIVTAMSLGIVVDDTIHFLSKYLYARRKKGFSAEDAVRYAFSTVGIALWITSVALVAGFLVLSTSSFALNSDMGLLTAIVITLALIVDFLLLPPLLIYLDSWLNDEKRILQQPLR